MMLILSWQSTECAEELEAGRPWRCDESLAEWRDEFADAYDWLAFEMSKRIGDPPEGVRWPVWGWHTYDFVSVADGGSPDEDTMIDPHVEQDYVRMLLDVPDDEVVLTDEDAWVMVTMGGPVPPVEWAIEGWSEEHDAEFDRMLENEIDENGKPTPETVATWERVFDIRRVEGEDDWNGCYVQATMWEIRPEWVVRIDRMHNEPHRSEYDYDFEDDDEEAGDGDQG